MPVANSPIQRAGDLFKRYADLERAFDPSVADLYADDALIRNTRRYPFGKVRVMTIPATQYKGMVRSTMWLARLRGDYSSYSDVNFKVEQRGVRITATRFSELKSYSSPISILIGRRGTGPWLILEEISESQP